MMVFLMDKIFSLYILPNKVWHGVSTHVWSDVYSLLSLNVTGVKKKFPDWTSWNVTDGCLTKHSSPEEDCQSVWLIWAEAFIQPESSKKTFAEPNRTVHFFLFWLQRSLLAKEVM